MDKCDSFGENMETIYTGPDGQKLFLYTDANFIFLRTVTGCEISRPTLLGNDYETDFSSTIFQETVYFTYKNIHGDLIMRNILTSAILFRLPAEDSPGYYSPRLFVFGDKLYLFYFVINPLNNSYLLQATCPFEQTSLSWSPLVFSKLPGIQFIDSGNNMILVCNEKDAVSFYKIDKFNNCEKVTFISYNEIQKQTNELLAQKDSQIAYIKRQYDELMNTATSYRDEAAKWYNRYVHERQSV